MYENTESKILTSAGLEPKTLTIHAYAVTNNAIAPFASQHIYLVNVLYLKTTWWRSTYVTVFKKKNIAYHAHNQGKSNETSYITIGAVYLRSARETHFGRHRWQPSSFWEINITCFVNMHPFLYARRSRVLLNWHLRHPRDRGKFALVPITLNMFPQYSSSILSWHDKQMNESLYGRRWSSLIDISSKREATNTLPLLWH